MSKQNKLAFSYCQILLKKIWTKNNFFKR